jgi:hypothetical protein
MTQAEPGQKNYDTWDENTGNAYNTSTWEAEVRGL